MKAEEYLRDCVQGDGANEVVSYAEALFAIQLKEEEFQEYKQSLISQDVENFVNEALLEMCELNGIDGYIKSCDIHNLLEIIEKKHKEEVNKLKSDIIKKTEDVIYSNENLDGLYSLDALFEELKRQILKECNNIITR